MPPYMSYRYLQIIKLSHLRLFEDFLIIITNISSNLFVKSSMSRAEDIFHHVRILQVHFFKYIYPSFPYLPTTLAHLYTNKKHVQIYGPIAMKF